MTRYGLRLGCRFGQPHDFRQIKDTPKFKIEICALCRIRKCWNKDEKGRVKNAEYLKMHVRNYAQITGPTARVYKKLYAPEKLKIVL